MCIRDRPINHVPGLFFQCSLLGIGESAISICFGCKLYNIFKKQKATHCPGGVCEIQIKDESQKFNLIQKSMVIFISIFIIVGLYSFSVNTPNNSFVVKMMKTKFLSNDELYELELNKEFADDDLD